MTPEREDELRRAFAIYRETVRVHADRSQAEVRRARTEMGRHYAARRHSLALEMLRESEHVAALLGLRAAGAEWLAQVRECSPSAVRHSDESEGL
jgi:hypothetical protein